MLRLARKIRMTLKLVLGQGLLEKERLDHLKALAMIMIRLRRKR